MLGYAALVWFAVVYMAEHWVIDVAVGLALALMAYTLVEAAARYLSARRARQAVERAPHLSATASSRPGAQRGRRWDVAARRRRGGEHTHAARWRPEDKDRGRCRG